MKILLSTVSFFIVGFLNAQIMPLPLITNHNSYPTTINADASFDIESATSGLATNTYPAIKSDFTFNFTNTTPYTIQYIFNKVVNTSSTRGFIGFSSSADGLTYSEGSMMFYELENGVIRNYVKNEYNGGDIALNNIGGFIVGTSYQITTTYDGTRWKHYINGNLSNTVTNTGTWTGSAKLILGNTSGATNIILDEVRFWDKALTADEITNNWDKPLTGYESGLKVYYDFNHQGYPAENNSTIKFLKDKTPNNNKGIFTNMSLSGNKNNFVIDKAQFVYADYTASLAYNDKIALDLDANNLDSYPGTGKGSVLIPGGYVWHDLSSIQSLNFYNSLSYNKIAAPILIADGGRSLFIQNIYGRTNLNTFISGKSSKTIEAWVKFNTLDNNSVVSIGNIADYDLFEMAAVNNKLVLNIGAALSSNLNIKSTSTLSTNRWYHVVITYNQNFGVSSSISYGAFRIYINGVKDNDYFISHGAGNDNIDLTRVHATSTNVYIGNSLSPFNGKLGILKVYRRELKANEILDKYNATKTRFGH
jgi:hypothetical protein